MQDKLAILLVAAALIVVAAAGGCRKTVLSMNPRITHFEGFATDNSIQEVRRLAQAVFDRAETERRLQETSALPIADDRSATVQAVKQRIAEIVLMPIENLGRLMVRHWWYGPFSVPETHYPSADHTPKAAAWAGHGRCLRHRRRRSEPSACHGDPSPFRCVHRFVSARASIFHCCVHSGRRRMAARRALDSCRARMPPTDRWRAPLTISDSNKTAVRGFSDCDTFFFSRTY